jgi:hypothetical protein
MGVNTQQPHVKTTSGTETHVTGTDMINVTGDYFRYRETHVTGMDMINVTGD